MNEIEITAWSIAIKHYYSNIRNNIEASKYEIELIYLGLGTKFYANFSHKKSISMFLAFFNNNYPSIFSEKYYTDWCNENKSIFSIGINELNLHFNKISQVSIYIVPAQLKRN